MTPDERRTTTRSTETTGKGAFGEKEIAKMRLLYESNDRKLCLFEDAHGHLTSVRSSKLV